MKSFVLCPFSRDSECFAVLAGVSLFRDEESQGALAVEALVVEALLLEHKKIYLTQNEYVMSETVSSEIRLINFQVKNRRNASGTWNIAGNIQRTNLVGRSLCMYKPKTRSLVLVLQSQPWHVLPSVYCNAPSVIDCINFIQSYKLHNVRTRSFSFTFK